MAGYFVTLADLVKSGHLSCDDVVYVPYRFLDGTIEEAAAKVVECGSSFAFSYSGFITPHPSRLVRYIYKTLDPVNGESRSRGRGFQSIFKRDESRRRVCLKKLREQFAQKTLEYASSLCSPNSSLIHFSGLFRIKLSVSTLIRKKKCVRCIIAPMTRST